MKNTLITILSLLLIIAGIYIFFSSFKSGNETIKAYNERDSLQILFNSKQESYDSVSILKDKIQAELVISRAQVKRSEYQLAKSKEKERIALKAKKETIHLMTQVVADSIILSHYKTDPDSISQKVVFDLERVVYCDSVRNKQTELLNDYSVLQSKSDSTVKLQSILLKDSRDQISILLSSQDKDKQVIDIKDKQIKKLKRRNKFLKIIAPVAFLAGVFLAL